VKRIVIALLIALSVILPGLSFGPTPTLDIPNASAVCVDSPGTIYNGGSYLSGLGQLTGCSGWNQLTVCIGYSNGNMISCTTVYGTGNLWASRSCTRDWSVQGVYGYGMWTRLNSGPWKSRYPIQYFNGPCY
jgi:hypothetical protein